MKIITWNCNMAFRKKATAILAYAPDLLIVQECECLERLHFPENYRQPTDQLWFGGNKNKGMAIFSFGDFRFKVSATHNADFKMIIPIEVTGGPFDFNLFAIWANNPADPDGHYVTQTWKAMRIYDQLLTEKPAILTGDFNSNTIWDYKSARTDDHSGLVQFLAERQIFSTYHLHHRQPQGQEMHPTMYLYRHRHRPYHIDYCFASAGFCERLQSVEIGDFDTWRPYSDHSPLIVNFE